MQEAIREPIPPFNAQTAAQKVRMAEDAWNGKNPQKVAQAYSPDSKWRNRDQFLQGRAEIEAFLVKKWLKEANYKLVKELWAYTDNRIAVRFAYEWQDENGDWFRSYGNENWEFTEDGYMHTRIASINDLAIKEEERKLTWTTDKRPEVFPTLSELGL